MGLELRDLFPPKPERAPKPEPERKIVATYSYVDESGKLLFEVVRYEPKAFAQRQPDGKGSWIWNLNGVRRVLYRLPDVLRAVQSGETIFVVEGEKDADALCGLGLVATTNPQGAGKWREDYSETLKGAHVVVIPDNDDAGRKHADQVAKSLWGKASSIKVVELSGDSVKDVSDWLRAGGTKDQLLELVAQAPEWKPAPTVSYDELRATFGRWLYLPDDTPLRFILCAVIANKLPGDPFWAFLVAPSGSAKTELLNAITGLDFVKPLDMITTNTFLSGKQRKDPNASLLLRVPNGTIFVMRDFTSVLEMHTERRAEIFAQLRKIYDGHLTKYTGEGGESAELHWEGKVGLIAGVTPAIEGYRAFANTLGERFLYYYLPVSDRNEAARRALSNRENLRAMREELRQAVKGFLESLNIPDHVELPQAMQAWIVHVADFVSVARTGVSRDHYSSTREILDLPDPEVPTRLAQQLGALACAHAVLCGRACVSQDDLDLVAQVALACIPTRRRLIIKTLVEAQAAMETSAVAEMLDLPTATVRRDLEELTALKLAKRIKVGEGKADLWESTDLAVLGWLALTQTGTRVTVQNPVPDVKEGTLSEKPPSVCKGEVIEGGESLCWVGGISDKVTGPASGTQKPTFTQMPDEDSDDEDCPF
jgi:5S rRNA maturation endonuclease (ribonuclease M5)